MKLLSIIENIIKENYTGVDIRMFALFSHIFSILIKSLKQGTMDKDYQVLSIKYKDTQTQKPLDYFYEFIIKNQEQFLKSEENLQEGDTKKETLFKYWDDKGIDAKPIYHYLDLDDSNSDDTETIFDYKLEYFGGLENMMKVLEDRLEIGKPFRYFSGGYEINGIIISFNTETSKVKGKEIYYEVDAVINGETSSVTLLTTGEDYMLGDLWNNNTDLDEGIVEEIGYEIGDVLRNYVDSKIYNILGFLCDTTDYNVVGGEEFKKSVE